MDEESMRLDQKLGLVPCVLHCSDTNRKDIQPIKSTVPLISKGSVLEEMLRKKTMGENQLTTFTWKRPLKGGGCCCSYFNISKQSMNCKGMHNDDCFVICPLHLPVGSKIQVTLLLLHYNYLPDTVLLYSTVRFNEKAKLKPNSSGRYETLTQA